jgi:hypothetical protein
MDAAPPPAPVALAPGTPALVGTVAPSGTAGQTVVVTADGPTVLQARTALPPGTLVALTPAAAGPAPVTAFDPLRGTDWPNLRQAFEALSAMDPGTARAVALHALPQATPRLAAAIGTVLRSVREGDARRLLGERGAGALLSAGREDILRGLDEDLGRMSRQAAEPLTGEWRAHPLPFSDGAELSRIQLYLRKPVEEEQADPADERRRGGGTTRFLVEVELSRLGAIQLDGLMRERRLDLILRTREPLLPAMRQDISRILTTALEAMGMTGGASFQPGARGWVTVQPTAQPGRGLLA